MEESIDETPKEAPIRIKDGDDSAGSKHAVSFGEEPFNVWNVVPRVFENDGLKRSIFVGERLCIVKEREGCSTSDVTLDPILTRQRREPETSSDFSGAVGTRRTDKIAQCRIRQSVESGEVVIGRNPCRGGAPSRESVQSHTLRLFGT